MNISPIFSNIFIPYRGIITVIFVISITGILFCQQTSDSSATIPLYESNLIEKENISGIWDETPIKPVKDIAVTLVNDGWSLITSPLRMDSTSFLVIPSIALTTWLFLIIDRPVTYHVLADKSYADSKLMKAAEYYGRNITSEVSAAAFTLAGIALSDKKIIRIGLEIFEAYYFANNLHSLVKRAFGRARPYEDKGAYYFDPFPTRKNPKNAFPSGHAVMSFSLSTVLASHVDNTYLKILAYTPAVLTCFSRIYQNQHWLSDVFVGAVIGYAVADFIVSRHNDVNNNFFTFGLDSQGRFSLYIPLD